MKFITLTNHRTGSSFLQRCLDSHPDILARQEDIRDIGRVPEKKMRNRINDVFAKNGQYKAVGFKVMYSHIRPWFFKYIQDNNIKIIHLIRRNILDTALWYPTNLKGNYVGGLGPRLKVNSKVIVDIKEVINKIKEIRGFIYQYSDMADFTLFYEEDLTNNGADTNEFYNTKTRKRLLEFLGVKDRPLKPKFRTGKSIKRENKEAIINYDDLISTVSDLDIYYV